jgi:hypothetical protein
MTLETFMRSKSLRPHHTEDFTEEQESLGNAKPGIVFLDLPLIAPHAYMASDEAKTRLPKSYTACCNGALNPQVWASQPEGSS